MEDMGKIMKEQGKEKNEEKKMEPKEMVTPKQVSLTGRRRRGT